jgi:outer membrane lipoprotein-sorting protein
MKSLSIARAAAAAALLGCCCSWPAAAADVPALTKAADRYRGGADDLQVETEVTVVHQDGTPDKQRRYTVFAQTGRRSLVLMRSPVEAGQKVLMLGDDFWLLLPGSQRPLRITPAQKLLGDAAVGDIATLSWADDYGGTLVAEEPCAEGEAGPPRCLHLSLRSARRSASYQRIELWIGRERLEPVRAELYLQSDKLAKLASFVMDEPGTPTRVDEMVLADRLGSQKETRVRYLTRQPKVVPEAWLNPMFLARNPALE